MALTVEGKERRIQEMSTSLMELMETFREALDLEVSTLQMRLEQRPERAASVQAQIAYCRKRYEALLDRVIAMGESGR